MPERLQKVLFRDVKEEKELKLYTVVLVVQETEFTHLWKGNAFSETLNNYKFKKEEKQDSTVL